MYCPLGDIFKRGKPALDEDDYPLMAEIVTAWDTVTEKLTARLESITEAELSAKSDIKVPGNDDTLVALVTFMAFHESYHIGQVSLIQRLYGMEGLVG